MHVTSSVWPHSSGVSASRIHRLLWKTPAMWSRREGRWYKHHTLQLRCFLMALKRLSKGKPLCWRAGALPSVNTILHAFVNKEASPSVGSSMTWFTSFVTLKTWWVKSGVGIPHWAGFPSDLKWLEWYGKFTLICNYIVGGCILERKVTWNVQPWAIYCIGFLTYIHYLSRNQRYVYFWALRCKVGFSNLWHGFQQVKSVSFGRSI